MAGHRLYNSGQSVTKSFNISPVLEQKLPAINIRKFSLSVIWVYDKKIRPAYSSIIYRAVYRNVLYCLFCIDDAKPVEIH